MADNKKKKDVQKVSGLGLDADKNKDFSEWYSQVILRAELISYYDISGCYILRPWSYSIWESIQQFFDREIKKLGVQNAYFPLFVTEKALTAEADHIEGFAPEVAWVTRAGKSPLKEPIAVRPTSETIMYPAYAKWIQSHRDLPLKLNQWVNVVRWEFKRPTPFLRSREFLWQEGHTAFSTLEEAAAEVLDILELYRRVYEEVLAVPVVKGKKTEKEKFPGGHYTTTVEAFIPVTGRGVQGATSHCLGQNFAKMFKIQFESDKGAPEYAWQNSWGLTTRSIGVMIMTHGDNRGLVLPPRAAPTQVVIVPITVKEGAEQEEVLKAVKNAATVLEAAGIRVHADTRNQYTPGWKFFHWELKGVPVRLEVGPKDVANKSVLSVRRDKEGKEAKSPLPFAQADGSDLVAGVKALLNTIQNDLYAKAKATHSSCIAEVTEWSQFVPALDARKLVLAPFCNTGECEDKIKEDTVNSLKTKQTEKQADKKKTGKEETKEQANNNNNNNNADVPPEEEGVEPLTGAAKSLCIPFDQPSLKSGMKCFHCGKEAKVWCYFGRSY